LERANEDGTFEVFTYAELRTYLSYINRKESVYEGGRIVDLQTQSQKKMTTDNEKQVARSQKSTKQKKQRRKQTEMLAWWKRRRFSIRGEKNMALLGKTHD